jgi:2-dehydropantoate 2-reductase
MNASASALTGVFRCPLGEVADNPHIWTLCRKLIGEAAAVAGADGYAFDEEEITEEIRGHLLRSKGGITSVYADLEAGRKTEVDAITGAVAALGRQLGVPVPVSETVAEIIHAMEERK